ncbi:hypothetical protein SF83666_a43090 (plasmid) [Sinorhizobium fredii CCBAU 83666]|nr:hypothetical protein SF83666_a43090 [Sinorhizobium fredii CCBAU 83666]
MPEERAFWELARIVFTETPHPFSDAIRFAVFKVQIIMGFRIGEAVREPLDRKRWREYLDADGRPAADRGGFSRSLIRGLDLAFAKGGCRRKNPTTRHTI